MNKIVRFVFIFVLFVSVSLQLVAQKAAKKDTVLNRSVTVEKEYIPAMLNVAKVNVLPSISQPQVPKNRVDYCVTVNPYEPLPYIMKPMTLSLDQTTGQKGYFRVGYGNNGNYDVKFGYLYQVDSLSSWMSNFSLDGYSAILHTPFAPSYGWTSKQLMATIDESYQHSFTNWKLRLNGNFGLQNLNYIKANDFSSPMSNNTNYNFNASFESPDGKLPIRFVANAALLGYNHHYGPNSSNEMDLKLQGNFWTPLKENDDHTIYGLKLISDNFIYSSDAIKDYYLLQVNPYLEYNATPFNAHVGAHVDLSGKGTAIQISPDVSLSYLLSESFSIYGGLNGGTQVNDFRALNDYCPYWGNLSSWKNSYVNLDARIGAIGKIGGVFQVNVYAGTSVVKNDLITRGLFTYGDNSYILVDNAKTSHTYIGADVKYNYKGLLELSVSGLYNNWFNTPDSCLLQKNRVEWNLGAVIHVNKKLLINGAYQIRIHNFGEVNGASYRMETLNNFSVGASYKVLDKLNVYGRVNNILNRKYQNYYAYPTQKFNFLAGIALRF